MVKFFDTQLDWTRKKWLRFSVEDFRDKNVFLLQKILHIYHYFFAVFFLSFETIWEVLSANVHTEVITSDKGSLVDIASISILNVFF